MFSRGSFVLQLRFPLSLERTIIREIVIVDTFNAAKSVTSLTPCTLFREFRRYRYESNSSSSNNVSTMSSTQLGDTFQMLVSTTNELIKGMIIAFIGSLKHHS